MVGVKPDWSGLQRESEESKSGKVSLDKPLTVCFRGKERDGVVAREMRGVHIQIER